MMIQNTQPSLDLLPEEIIEEILSTLDVKSLLRFRCVLKSYRSLIDSKRFIKTHLQKSKEDTNLSHHRVLIFSNTDTRETKVSICSLLSFIDNLNRKALPMTSPTTFPARCSSIYFVGCCNGLVRILLDMNMNSEQFMLWNPSTRISKNIPEVDKNKIGYKYKRYGLGWDESSDDYKIIAIFSVDGQTMCKIYSLKTDSWKEINVFYIYGQRCQPGKLVNGKLYWVCKDLDLRSGHNKREIVAFDLGREVFEIVEQPTCWSEDSLWCLATYEECLSVLCVCRSSVDIWVMKESGVKVSWERVMIIYHNNKLGIWTSPSSLDEFYIGKGRDIVLMRPSIGDYTKYMAYDLKRKEIHFENFPKECDIYVESLVSPLEETCKSLALGVVV